MQQMTVTACVVSQGLAQFDANFLNMTQYADRGVLQYKIYSRHLTQKFGLWPFMTIAHYLNMYQSHMFHKFRSLKSLFIVIVKISQ